MIGIFDSGIGGLTVVQSIMEQLPSYDIIYFGDTARTPYGTKSSETVIKYALEAVEFLIENGAQIIIIACNTASSTAFKSITKVYDIPVFEVISPAVELSVEKTEKNYIGIIGTRATVNSNIYEKKIKEIKPEANVYSYACPLLVPLVEEGWFNRPETRMIVKKYLHPLKTRQIDTLILGCTHYPLLQKIIQSKIGKKVTIVDSSLGVAQKIKNFLALHPELDNRMGKNKKALFFVSDITVQFEKIASLILKRKVSLKQAVIKSHLK